MSRRIDRPIAVVCAPDGAPVRVGGQPVVHVYSRHREWIGALEGEPERDIWRVETDAGIAELHQIQGAWLLARWDD